jgi:hypothetical protein
MDNADKAPGKAISYAKKYAVLKLFEIETGEDEESRYPDLELLSKEKFDQFCASIRACITTDKAKGEWQKGLAACQELGDVGSANLLKRVLLDHAEFIDKAAK